MILFNPNIIPESPGVYTFKDQSGLAIYVGKAANLRTRLKSYFAHGIRLGDKTRNMLRKAASLSYTQTLSEVEALILEAALIKKLKPHYNISLKDDKAYQYIQIDDYRDEIFPKVMRVRKLKSKNNYFGPYPQGKAVFEIYLTLRKIFKFRDCGVAKFQRHSKLKRPCLFYDLDQCSAPCALKITPRDYKSNLNEMMLFLKGRSGKLDQTWKAQADSYIRARQFEKANTLKHKLQNLAYIRQQSLKAEQYIKNPNIYHDTRREELKAISKMVSNSCITRIECFDVSNIQGEYAVGAKVCFVNGEPLKTAYRRYKIKTVKGISDTSMLREILLRRLKSKSDLPLPDLLVVDGGIAQVRAAHAALRSCDINIPLLGLAKRRETVVMMENTINLPRSDIALQLLQRIRDEAHRFGVSYHKLLFKKSLG